MGVLDNIFGGDKGSAVPGGNVAKPLMIALLALLASRYMSGGGQKEVAPPPRQDMPPQPSSIPDESPGSIVGGLGGLLKQFQQAGLGEVVDSWINTGPNKTVAPGQIADALGPDVIDALSQRTRLPRDQVVAILSQLLPNAVDQLTPEGRLPTHQKAARLVGSA
jgi:uncharacterized protein YidB (DUF937 family)